LTHVLLLSRVWFCRKVIDSSRFGANMPGASFELLLLLMMMMMLLLLRSHTYVYSCSVL